MGVPKKNCRNGQISNPPFFSQKLLGVSQADIKQKCQERVKELEELKSAVDSLKVGCTNIFFFFFHNNFSIRTKVIVILPIKCLSFQNSAQRAMVESQKMFEDMIRSIERMRSEVTKLIGINEKAAFNQAEALIERLEQEIDELKKKESGLKQLYSTDDHIHFLQVRRGFPILIFTKNKHATLRFPSKLVWMFSLMFSLTCSN